MKFPFAHLWDKAFTYQDFVRASAQHREMWTGVYRTARIPDELVAEAAALGGRFRLLAIVEDWCGDASNTVPVIARWAEKLPNVELRLVRRDEQFDLMGGYLTGKSRSIPIVVVLTDAMEEIGRWGPRPAELQAWVLEQERLRAVLAEALGIAGTVKKVRALYISGQTRIHLDEVEGLGRFVELEVVLAAGQKEEEGRRIAESLMKELGISKSDLIDCAYVDMLSRKQG